MRHRRHRRRRARTPDARGHAGRARSPRARRSGHVPGRRRRARHDAAGDHRPRHRPPADDQRRRQHDPRLQRRDLQLPRAARRARSARPSLPHAERHRGDPAGLGGRRRGLRRAPARDVRLRHLGRAPAHALPGARSRRQEAALLLAGRRRLRLRLRDQGALLPSGAGPRRGLDGAASLPRLRLHAGATLGVRRHREAAARSHGDADRRHAEPAPLLGPAARARGGGTRRHARAPRAAPSRDPRGRAAPAGE